MAEPLAVFRVDAAPEIGGGHAVRCLALANALRASGWRCAFAGRPETVDMVPALAHAGYDWWPLSIDADGAGEPAQLRAKAGGCDLLVTDHYGRDSRFESACRGWARRILAIDDLGDRSHDADILHDPLVGRDATDYAYLVPDRCRLLLSPAYAPLRPQFFRARAESLARRRDGGEVHRVMVSLGATDPGNVTAVVLEGLSQVSADLVIDVVMGPLTPHLDRVQRLAQALPQQIRVHVGVADMAALMSLADLAIGAAGTTSWERCAVGLPTLMVVTAANQRAIADALVARGAAQGLGEGAALTPEQVAGAVLDFVQSPRWRVEMVRRAALVCDGRGAARLAMAVAPARAKDGRPVTLRPASMDDAEIMLAWQCAPGVRRFARNPAMPGEAEHRDWLAARLENPDCLLNIVLHGDEPAGVLRLDAVCDTSRPTFEVSILIAPDRQGLGLGRAALMLGRRLAPEAEFLAEVHEDNAASHALFRSAAFTLRDGAYRLAPGAEDHP